MIFIEIEESLYQFLRDPETVDFMARRSEYFESIIKQYKGIYLEQMLAGQYILGYASRTDFEEIINRLGTSYISSASLVLGTLDRPALEASGVLQVQEQPYLDLRGQGVILGFVDTGIDYTLDVFRYEDGSSKIISIFDQTIQGIPPYEFYLGTEYTQEQINEALRSPDPHKVVPHVDNSGHGTFLASVAAGHEKGEFLGAAPDADIIAVKLRRARPYYLERYAVPETQENAFETTAIMVGVEYILKKARSLDRPVSICIGLGTNFGSHDGYSLFEEYLSGVSNLNGVCLCIAAGNESQARHHTQGVITAQGETQNVDVRVGENAGDIYISIWNNASDRISVSIRSPTGELVDRIPARVETRVKTKLILERTTVLVEYHFPLEGTGSQLTVVKLIDATPGIWTITLHGSIILDGTFHAWLPMTGFVSPTVEFLSASPYYTITVPGTMPGIITCGAYDTYQEILYAKSSWGPNRLGFMSPDLAAPGVNVAGYFPSGPGTMDGTSVAAAITAGACALMLQWGIVEGNDPAFSTYQIRAYLIRGCTRSEAMKYPNPQWGYGKLNLMQSFYLMREL